MTTMGYSLIGRDHSVVNCTGSSEKLLTLQRLLFTSYTSLVILYTRLKHRSKYKYMSCSVLPEVEIKTHNS